VKSHGSGRLLLRHAMDRSQPKHQIAASNPDNFPVGEKFSELI
jgi:hypothetical protein